MSSKEAAKNKAICVVIVLLQKLTSLRQSNFLCDNHAKDSDNWPTKPSPKRWTDVQ